MGTPSPLSPPRLFPTIVTSSPPWPSMPSLRSLTRRPPLTSTSATSLSPRSSAVPLTTLSSLTVSVSSTRPPTDSLVAPERSRTPRSASFSSPSPPPSPTWTATFASVTTQRSTDCSRKSVSTLSSSSKGHQDRRERRPPPEVYPQRGCQ